MIDRAYANLAAAMEPFTTAPTDREYHAFYVTQVAPLNHRSLVASELLEPEPEEDI